jgi:O-antigen/teichoic acid export membrane protein
LFASLPLTIFIFIFADKITWLIFGEAFSRSTIALQIQILGLTLLFLLSIFESLFVILKRQHQLIVVVGSGLFLSLILNIILAPRYGYVGASLITLISGIVMFIVSVHMLSDFFEGYSLIKVMYRPILAASVTTFVLYVIPAFHNMVLASVGLLIIFILMLFILNAFSHKEILFMKAVGQKLRWNNITNSNI